MANTTPNNSSIILQPLYVSEATATGTSQAPKSVGVHPRLASLADAGLRASMTSKSPKVLNSAHLELPRPYFTGAGALADLEAQRRQREQEASQMTSANPAATAMSALRGEISLSHGISRINEAPLSRPQSTARSSNLSFHETIGSELSYVDRPPPVPVRVEAEQRESTTGIQSSPSAAQKELLTPVEREIYMPSDQQAERSNKAVTYPAPQPNEQEQTSSLRHMSLPNNNNISAVEAKSPFKKHKCPYCATEFTRHHNLKSHLLTHSKEKPFSCSTCNHKFRRLHDLKRHTKLHTGERSYVCSKCGRRFARGDALARHSKGPGGCAGRRGSAEADEEYGDGTMDGEDGMEGVIYNREDHESDHGLRESLEGEPSMEDSTRRRSEPHRRTQESQDEADQTTNRPSQHSSTYPGSAVMAAPRSAYTKVSEITSPRESPRVVSPRSGAPSYSSVHYNAPPSTYAHGSMTESPRPLSPGQDPNRLGVTELGSASRGRAPSLSSNPQYPYSERHQPVATSCFAISQGSHGTQLPPLTSMTGNGPFSPHLPPHISVKVGGGVISGNALSSHHTTSHGAAGATSNASSISSHHRGSVGSTRELFNGMGPTGAHDRESNMWEHMQSLESQLIRLQETLRTQEAHYQETIARLQDEVAMLRNQHKER